MKKIILSVAALSAALAQAQVGINQETPKATLDISVKKDNLDTNSQEGLLIPRVTKEKALKMANNSTAPEESVLIYVNDVANYTSAPDEKVNDITEKGYYFWNGTKWVKSSGVNGELWAQREVNGVIETYLKPADANNDFVGYDSNRNFKISLGTNDNFGFAGVPLNIAISSKTLPLSSPWGAPTEPQYLFSFSKNVIEEDHVNSAVTNQGKWYAGNQVSIETKNVTSSIQGIEGVLGTATHTSNSSLAYLTGTIGVATVGREESSSVVTKRATGIYGRVGVEKNSIAEQAVGGFFVTRNKGTVGEMKGISTVISSQLKDEITDSYPVHTIKNMRGMDNSVTVSPNATVEKDIMGSITSTIISENVTMNADQRIYGNLNHVSVESALPQNDIFASRNTFNLSADGAEVRDVVLNQVVMHSKASTPTTVNRNMFAFNFWNGEEDNWKADKMFGVYLDDIKNGQTANYGIYMENVGNGTATDNYSIYTNKGKLRFGDLASTSATTDRVVTVDNDGVLKTQDVTAFANANNEWVYNSTDNRIELKQGGQGVFKNKVYYSPNGYRFLNKNITALKGYDYINSAIQTYPLNDIKPFYLMALNSSELDQVTLQDSYSSSYNYSGIRYYMNIDGLNSLNASNSNINSYSYFTGIDENNTQEYRDIVGLSSSVEKMNNANIGALTGIKARNVVGGTGDINTVIGLSSFSLLDKRGGVIEDMIALESYNRFRPSNQVDVTNNYGTRTRILMQGSGSVENMYTYYAQLDNRGYSGTIDRYYDYYGDNQGLVESSVTKLYGIYIKGNTKTNYLEGKLGIGTDTPTEKLEVNGKIKASSLAGSGERIVIADAEGVLKTNTTSLADLESLWKKESTSNRIVLKENSAGAPRTSASGTSRNDVTISDEGKITARGFVGYNGATIFPDYVFEKYYTGESTIKADYNFHSLASVESFIKTNGHLPGYTSAKEIASKGLIDLGATQLTNVEKIEELYLHTIEQEKALKAKDTKIEKLESELQAQKDKINSQEERLSKLEQLLK